MSILKKKMFLSFAIVLLASQGALADSIQAEWNDFQTHPRAFLTTLPKKVTTGDPSAAETLFSAQQIRSREFVEKKAQGRQATLNRPQSFHALFVGTSRTLSRVRSFLDMNEFRIRGLTPVLNLKDIDALKLRSGSLDAQPWSGSYWPLYQGGLGARYASEGFNTHSETWQSSYDYVKTAGDLASVLKRGNRSELDELSPAEKYDLLIGAPTVGNASSFGFLTPLMWADGEAYRNGNGKVETWMGYCHGWAPAAFEDPRPAKVIEVPSATKNLNVQFYPADLKGLSTLMWAKGDFSSTFVGGRCDEKKPNVDPNSGRLLNPDCFDVDPGLWHLIVINQLGQLKRGLVIDATYDYQVWNQPLFNYETTYFNPQTGQSADDLAAATVSVRDFSKDKFKKFRHREGASYVGVQMTIQYVSETSPTHAVADSPDDDVLQTVSYLYDLELNAAGDIIGGEWYKNAHPDFLWAPQPGERPKSAADGELPGAARWDLRQPLPAFWRDVAVRTASSSGEPVSKIVEALVDSAAN